MVIIKIMSVRLETLDSTEFVSLDTHLEVTISSFSSLFLLLILKGKLYNASLLWITKILFIRTMVLWTVIFFSFIFTAIIYLRYIDSVNICSGKISFPQRFIVVIFVIFTIWINILNTGFSVSDFTFEMNWYLFLFQF